MLFKIRRPTMSLEYDFVAISQLAIKVYTACKDAPDIYGDIADKVAGLHLLITTVELQVKSTTISSNDCRNGQEILKGCQSVLVDLNSRVEKY